MPLDAARPGRGVRRSLRRRAIASPSSYALLSLGEASLDGSAFDRRGSRAGGALGSAVATHAIVFLLILGFARLRPAVTTQPVLSSAIGPFLFTDTLGAGSGRSGGGNRSTEPAAVARTRGADLRAVPALSTRTLATPDTIGPERDAVPALPVAPTDAGVIPELGALDGLPGPPTDARGPRDTGIGTRTGPDRGVGAGPGDGIGDGPYGVGNGVTGPDLIHRTPPQ